MSHEDSLTKSICTNLLRVVEQLQSASGSQSTPTQLQSSSSSLQAVPRGQAEHFSEQSDSTLTSSTRHHHHSEALRHLFRSKTKAVSPFDRKGKRRKLTATSDERYWKHNFVCLSNKDQSTVPDGTEKAILKLAGLGEKSLTLLTSEDLTYQLYNEFSQLKDSGGYELMRQGPNRTLELIPIPPEGYTVDYVQSVVPHAKLYIRPIQIDLNINEVQCT
uniref:Uncharacterized protein n=1 Tax=Amphimedon queenslandica TaxID=400682 RepID=A0A1X7SFH0_AMPQE